MLLAGILLKMGAYGMYRFCWEFMPEAAQSLAPWLALLAVINIVYTAGVALVQKDLKKLIAYSSVSHMGFVLLGLTAMNPAGYTGAIFVMFAHGIVSAALFMCVGTVYVRTHTRMIADLGGFGAKMPTIFYFFMFMAMASLGLPLLISFASETLVFYGAYISRAIPDITLVTFPSGNEIVWNMQTVTMLSALGIIIGAAYLLWMLQRVFFGPMSERWDGIGDAKFSEVFVLVSLSILVVAYGFRPMWVTDFFAGEAADAACQMVQPDGESVWEVPAGCEYRTIRGRLTDGSDQPGHFISLERPAVQLNQIQQ
jgi:NADH-quinone oxidoreductase subunit M